MRRSVASASSAPRSRPSWVRSTSPTLVRASRESCGGQKQDLGVRLQRCDKVVVVDRVAQHRACESKRLGIAVLDDEPSPPREMPEPHQPGGAARRGSSDGENDRRHLRVAGAYRVPRAMKRQDGRLIGSPVRRRLRGHGRTTLVAATAEARRTQGGGRGL